VSTLEYLKQDSILTTIKKMLGLNYDYTAFDADIVVFINSALMELNQLGVGPKKGFRVRDYSQTWGELLVNDVNLESAKDFIYLNVKLKFDPPAPSVISAYERDIAELKWRLNVQAESVETFDFVSNGESRILRTKEGLD